MCVQWGLDAGGGPAVGADGKPPASLSASAGAVLLQVSGHVLALLGRNRNGGWGGGGGLDEG